MFKLNLKCKKNALCLFDLPVLKLLKSLLKSFNDLVKQPFYSSLVTIVTLL